MAHGGFPILGLAADAIRVLDLGSTLFSDAREIYNSSDGKSAEHQDLETTVTSLNQLCSKLVGQAPSGRDEEGIHRLARLAGDVADELKSSLQRLQKPNARQHRLTSLRQSLGWMLNKDVGHLRPKLSEIRSQLCTEIIAYSSIQQQQALKRLDSIGDSVGLQFDERIAGFKEELSRVADLEPVCKGLQDLTKIVSKLSDAKTNVDRLDKEHRILSSLQFEHMNTRRIAIVEAHETTFRWILTSGHWPPSDPRSNIKLRRWLREEDGIYWVSGKPGSGKSTLMKYLGQCEDTMECLQVWASDSRVAMPSFYFWISGSPMQKSQQGLLQQLLFELLQAFPDIMPIICSGRWDTPKPSPWSVPELLAAIKRIEVVHAVNVPSTRICFFIDGLDEYHGDHRDLIATVKAMARIPGVKACVSSRPWNCFKDAFGRDEERLLRLEDLTREDIANYAASKLSEDEEHGLEQPVRNILVGGIVERAQGVFLWVYLVVRSLRDGFENGDSLAILEERLKEFPSDLDEFFNRLIMSVDKVYRRRMSMAFQVALKAHQPMRLIQYHFLGEEDDILISNIQLNLRQLRDTNPAQDGNDRVLKEEARVYRQLNGRYKGLLEAPGFPEYRTVDFIHRTVGDFLMTKEMQILLSSYCSPDFDPSVHACTTLIAQCARYPESGNYDELEEFMNWARNLEVERRGVDPRLMKYMDQSCHSGVAGRPVRSDTFVGRAVAFGIASYIDYITTKEPSILTDAESDTLTMALMGNTDPMTYPEAELEMMKRTLMLILSRGPNPYTDPKVIRSVETFFASFKDFQGYDQYWETAVETILKQGVDVKLAFRGAECWLAQRLRDMVISDGRMKGMEESTLRTLELFFNHGFDPNSSTSSDRKVKAKTVWETVIVSVITSQAAHGYEEETCAAMVELFLRHGADSSFRLRLTEDENCDGRVAEILRRPVPIVLVIDDILQFFTNNVARLRDTIHKAKTGYYKLSRRRKEDRRHKDRGRRQGMSQPSSKRRRLGA